MPFLENYIEIEEEENNFKNNEIKTYKAKREFIIKEIYILNEEEKISKIQLIKNITNENNIKIYDIIEKENSIFIIIDSDNEKSIMFDNLLEKSKEINFIKEVIIKGNGHYLKLSEIIELYKEGEKKTCKINLDEINGSGFFLEINENLSIPFKKVLFTCNHVLNGNYIKLNNKIKIKNKIMENYINIKNSELYTLENYKIGEKDLNKRKIFTDKYLDYTCIEILDNDFENNNIEFFEINNNQIEKDKDIFILQHPEGEDDLSYSLGQIIKKNNSTIYHSASTEVGSSGSPIINRKDYSVIGIHYGGTNNYNTAHDINYILSDIKSKLLNINIIKNIIKKLKDQNLINVNNNKYLEKEVLTKGKLGIIYKGENKENKNEILIISLNLFQFYENNDSKDENYLLEKIKAIINNIRKSNYKIYDIFIEENSINFVIEKYEMNFENYFMSKHKKLNFDEIKDFIIQLNEYIKIYKNLSINLDFISSKNILVRKENNKSIKYQFLFYYNKII